MTLASFRASVDLMKAYYNLFQSLCSYENLHLAYENARRHKRKKEYVIEFEKDLENNLYKLQWELLTHSYAPRPLKTFTVRDPKTRKISAAAFRDRVIHHAICNVISPIFESRFIHDTFANRKGKGTLAALKRFDFFMRKVSGNGKTECWGGERDSRIVGYALKCDIRHYFDTVDHEVLLSILRHRINDEEIIWLVKTILQNHKSGTPGKGMPLGNLTSQFLANVYLAELDNFVKHDLMAKYYLRYVDDFILLSRNRRELVDFKLKIEFFLLEKLKLQLHPDKSKIIPLSDGITLLGFRVFFYCKLLKKSNQNRIWKRLEKFRVLLADEKIGRKKIRLSLAGWTGYAKMADTFKLRQQVLREAEGMFD